MRRCEVDHLDPSRHYWVPIVVSPMRGWRGARDCRRGSRFMVDPRTLDLSQDEFDTFDSELTCLQWIMLHRPELTRNFPGAPVKAARLDLWLLGLN
jgi:hypothetical protein